MPYYRWSNPGAVHLVDTHRSADSLPSTYDRTVPPLTTLRHPCHGLWATQTHRPCRPRPRPTQRPHPLPLNHPSAYTDDMQGSLVRVLPGTCHGDSSMLPSFPSFIGRYPFCHAPSCHHCHSLLPRHCDEQHPFTTLPHPLSPRL